MKPWIDYYSVPRYFVLTLYEITKRMFLVVVFFYTEKCPIYSDRFTWNIITDLIISIVVYLYLALL